MYRRSKKPANRHFCVNFAFLASVLVFAAGSVYAQDVTGHENRTPVIEKIERAIRGGDMRTFLENASGKVIVRLFDDEKLYSQSQARYVLEEFFESNPARAFRFLEVSPPERSQFAVGTLIGEANRVLEIYVRLRQNGPDWVLREIRIRSAADLQGTSNR